MSSRLFCLVLLWLFITIIYIATFYYFFFFFFFFFCCVAACGILVPWPRMELRTPAVEAQNPNTGLLGKSQWSDFSLHTTQWKMHTVIPPYSYLQLPNLWIQPTADQKDLRKKTQQVPESKTWGCHSIYIVSGIIRASLVAQRVKNLLALWEIPGFDPWVRKIPWRREWKASPVFLPGEFYGQRSLVDYSPWGRKELDMT